MADQEEDFSQLPLPDRFTHKNWKVRKEGYEAAAKQFELTPDESDPAFRPFLSDSGLWKGAAGDSNVAAQQEGLAALCAFLKFGGQQAASRTRNLTVGPIYEKGLPSTRPAVKASALEALMLYVEVDKPDLVIEELLPGFSHKTPKVIAATINAVTALFHSYGTKILDPKPVLKALPKAFGHADKNVRAEASNLTVELYRWLKEALKAIFWNDLKPVQQQDLEKLFEKVKEEPPPKQERFTRAQQAAMATESAKPAAEIGGEDDFGGDAEEPAEVDAFDLAEPVDVFAKIPKDWQENLASTKWKERKEALDAISEALSTPRIKDGPFDDIVRACAKCMKDANIMVVVTAANCVEKLANGLRRSFGKYRSTIMSSMVDRLKEKKQTVVDAIGAALDATFASTSLSDCLEEIISRMTDKNPQVKLETIRFLIRCLKNTKEVPSKPEVKSIADAATKVLTDTQEVTRSAGAEVLGTLMKIMGERAMGPYMEGLDDIRKVKIKEYFEAAEVKAKDRPKPIAAPPKAAPVPAAGKKVGAPGAKKPTAVRKPGPTAAAPPPAPIEDPSPLKPKPTAKSLPKPGGLPKPGSGLKAPMGLKRPGSFAGGVQSPSRRVISPPTTEEEAPASPSIPAPRVGLGRGGLTGRPLGKPSFAPASNDSAPTPTPSSGLSAIEKAELEELRLEKDRLTKLTDELRSSNAKLTAEVSELQNQNAQLIEDHTRDVLQIKAKETQLVRARGENDVLRQEIETVRKDSERLKREVGRLGRESLGRERESLLVNQHDQPSQNNIYEDRGSPNGVSNGIDGNQPNSGLRHNRPASIITSQHSSSASVTNRPRSFILSPSEEKENSAALDIRRKISPSTGGNSNYSSGRTSPQRPGIGSRLATGASTSSDVAGQGAQGAQPGEPAENWKRAAEVTSQLKARIEQMKARQGLTRH